MTLVTYLANNDERDGTSNIVFNDGSGIVLQAGKSANLTTAQIRMIQGKVRIASGDVSTTVDVSTPEKLKTISRGKTIAETIL